MSRHYLTRIGQLALFSSGPRLGGGDPSSFTQEPMRRALNRTVLHWSEHGIGPPVLVLHGGLGLDQSTLRPWLDPLGERARLVFLDLRGCGQSEPISVVDHVTHATWVADADALRDHLGLDRWTVFGHSYGGFLALEYAIRYPERTSGLILCSTAPAFDHAGVAIANAEAQGIPEALAALADALSSPASSDEAFEATWRALAPLYLHRPTPEALSAITDGVRYRAEALNASQGRCLPTYDVRARLGEATSPTLVVSGRHDWIYPPEHGAVPLAEGIPGAELVLLEQSGHFPFVEEPGAFLAAVSSWLDRHAPRAP